MFSVNSSLENKLKRSVQKSGLSVAAKSNRYLPIHHDLFKATGLNDFHEAKIPPNFTKQFYIIHLLIRDSTTEARSKTPSASLHTHAHEFSKRK
jgi:hypothetical protein